MKLIIFFLLLIGLVSCKKETEQNIQNKSVHIQDTIVIKHRNELNKSYQVGFYSKSYSYYWLAGKDTLDLKVYAAEHISDSTLHLSIHHKKSITFDEVLKKIDECLPIIQDDFLISNWSSLSFKSPIYYPDIVNTLSDEYQQKFGNTRVDNQKLNAFLLQSKLNVKLNKFLNKVNKRTHQYSIEKFHFTNKEKFKYDLSDEDLSKYPDFSIHGMGIYIRLEDKQK